MKDHIDTILETTTPRQTPAEREQLFARVMSEVGAATKTPHPVPSPYVLLSLFSTKSRVVVAAVLIVVLGTSGTVAAAESAKPGDALFPIEQATEQLRLTLASAERRGDLEARFLEKRFAEVGELLSEESLVSSETEDRLISEAGELRIAGAIAVLLDHIERVNDPRQAERLRNLLREVETIQIEGRDTDRADDRRIRIDDTHFEVRTETQRIRIDDRDGEMRVRYDDDEDEEYEAAESNRSADTSDGSKQPEDDDRTIDDERDEVRERDSDEASDQKNSTGTAREEDNSGGDENREDDKSANSDSGSDSDSEEVDDQDKEDDRKGPSDDDKDR